MGVKVNWVFHFIPLFWPWVMMPTRLHKTITMSCFLLLAKFRAMPLMVKSHPRNLYTGHSTITQTTFGMLTLLAFKRATENLDGLILHLLINLMASYLLIFYKNIILFIFYFSVFIHWI